MRYFCVRCGLSPSRFYQLSRPIRAFQSEHAILLARQLVVVDEKLFQSTGELLAQIVDRLVNIAITNFTEDTRLSIIVGWFEHCGKVEAVRMRNGKNRAYAGVEMPRKSEAEAAINELQWKDVNGEVSGVANSNGPPLIGWITSGKKPSRRQKLRTAPGRPLPSPRSHRPWHSQLRLAQMQPAMRLPIVLLNHHRRIVPALSS